MFHLFQNLNKSALLKAIIASILTIVMVFIGSRNLQNFDAALIAYLFGAVFAIFGITYRYSIWLQRPPTKMYWKRSWQFLFSKYFVAYIGRGLRLFFQNILFQKFIYPRGRTRWIGHFLLATGCMLAFAITFPLTFGWIHFTLESGSLTTYEAHLFGFKMMDFQLGSFIAFLIFHALVWCSVLVIIGSIMMMKRRMTHGGLIATQTFDGDWLPLLLLIAISVTGIGITFDYTYLEGKTNQFMSVTHAVTVILFLVWIPFGKFFHIFQRPAQLGANIYKTEGIKNGLAKCPYTEEEFATQMHIDDLKTVTQELGFNFKLSNGKSHLDYSPEGKRCMLAKAHLKAREEAGSFFG
ncbi:MFS transporter [Apibacter muscae]|uniref:MFS transporter n=1 Tax=Apibacter muscae TaxID=2509004 RepID=A0A563DG45_9FLAO|nr:MFS transporter [Apibacter muscae]TWP29052.1 MFS transporter [Apibacter muscae]TWP30367.1 MFS transporter [Apibacter muscae]